jgi:hypothetical protein
MALLFLPLILLGCAFEEDEGSLSERVLAQYAREAAARTTPREVPRPEPGVCRFEMRGKVYTLGPASVDAAWEFAKMMAKLDALDADIKSRNSSADLHLARRDRVLTRERGMYAQGVTHREALWNQSNRDQYDFHEEAHAIYVEEHNRLVEEYNEVLESAVRLLQKHHDPELDAVIRAAGR